MDEQLSVKQPPPGKIVRFYPDAQNALLTIKYIYMIQITQSQEFVVHDRGNGHESKVRKYEKVCWDMIFSGKDGFKIIEDLNTRFLPHQLSAIFFNTENVEESFDAIKTFLNNVGYDIHVTRIPIPPFRTVPENY